MLIETKKHTHRDYEALPEGAPYQLIQGELVMTPSPTFDHQELVLNLATILKVFVETNHLGKIVTSPMDVYLTETDTYQPDIIFISNNRRHIIHDRIKGAPDLIIEVLSASNAYYDLVHKKNVYEATGVLEYWIVDPQEKMIEIYENDSGTFKLHAKAHRAGSVQSKLLSGFRIDAKDFFTFS